MERSAVVAAAAPALIVPHDLPHAAVLIVAAVLSAVRRRCCIDIVGQAKTHDLIELLHGGAACRREQLLSQPAVGIVPGDVAVQNSKGVAEESVADEVGKGPAHQREILHLRVHPLHSARDIELTGRANVGPPLTWVQGFRPARQLTQAVDHILKAVVEGVHQLQGLHERHVSDHIVVDGHTQQLLAEVSGLPPLAEPFVPDTRRSKSDDRVGEARPGFGLGHCGGQDRKGSTEAVSREDKLPIARDAKEALRPFDVAFHPFPHMRQHALELQIEALVDVHLGGCWAVRPRSPQLHVQHVDVRVNLPVLG
mmetsp:Transcript_40989/g.97728  ORF Transcript_40989/g.97728 Transcript_40989/m.97728 type:complete len:310 (+) Transcript_40989:102-1031(+)